MNEYRYKNGLAILEILTEPDDRESLDRFDSYKGSLLRDLDEKRQFGGNDSAINRDIANLNRLARDLCAYSFNDLAVSRRDIEKTLTGILSKLPARKAHQAAARIFYNKNRSSQDRISEDNDFLQQLAIRYQIPLHEGFGHGPNQIGPDIDWRGPEEVELQSFLRPLPDMLDMGLLKQAVERSSAICLVRLPAKNRSGTGFLVAPGRVLTNYHVLKESEQDDLEANAHALKLSFGYLTNDHGTEPLTFELANTQPILSWSPVHELDYVLLQLGEDHKALDAMDPVTYVLEPPTLRSGLYILQHPQGEPMKLAIDDNSVTWVGQDTARVQYVTRTCAGSSGSPCFNQDWKVVALHHAERARVFGTIREGILFSRIYERIEPYLSQG